MNEPVVMVLQHDSSDPLLRMEQWLTESGAQVKVLRLFDGDEVPTDLSGVDGVISLGGGMGAWDDGVAAWLPATRSLLAQAVRQRTPTLGICLGSQLLAAATGGTVTVGASGPEIGAYLVAKRDAAGEDPLFAALPMTPDVMQYHYDAVTTLPSGAVLLLSGDRYQNQAWRLGECAWGVQFHFEPGAEDLRDWARSEGLDPESTRRLGPMLDEAEANMAEVWREFTHRFAALLRDGRSQERALAGRRLPLAGSQASHGNPGERP